MDDFEFDHVGIVTTEVHGEEDWVEKTKIWVTDPRKHPDRIEFLRLSPESSLPAIVSEVPHIAYRVKDMKPFLEAEGVEIVIPKFTVGDFLEVAYVKKHGVLFEYMRYLKEGWFGK